MKTNTLISDQSTICFDTGNEMEQDPMQKHKRHTHHVTDNFSSNKLNNDLNPKNSIDNESIYEIQPIASELSATTTNPPSAITIADLDTDEMPIRFRRDTNKSIVFSVSCLEHEFLRKYSSRVTQTASINSETMHLITNDDKHTLRSPLSMKLIEAIANHCFCVSYRAFEIEGDDTDYQSQGGPKRSCSIDKRHSFFENICFMIKCTENNDIKMTNDRLQDLITTERHHNYDECRSLGIYFVSSD
ncbi:unnamed protein product [Rotaria sp. Silwood2]|nr:unnamed protein product [Rotaria sp. Silwood2]